MYMITYVQIHNSPFDETRGKSRNQGCYIPSCRYFMLNSMDNVVSLGICAGSL